ncbi:MAG: glycoside hydrolase family 38 C-terminal domain-containing protein, partial [Cyanobacteriota bacterium]|nr:glycoside hydrolase family 38 C-terminal domain-containing protein [Cyanobacteriota bacterium]
ELHRGCYTTHADQKYYNRRCEDALYQAELWASLAAITLQVKYPQAPLEQAWKQVLFNQFHDILPGSSIPEVFEQANQDWQAALGTAQQVLHTALDQLAKHIPLPPLPHPEAQPVLLFNPLNWPRRELVELPLPSGPDRPWQGLDGQGQPLPTQISQPPGETVPRLLIQGPQVPALGYCLVWLVPAAPAAPPVVPPDWCLENDHLQVTIDGQTGNIASLVDRRRGQAVLRGPGNQLQAFADQGQYWDAWNIDPAYQAHPLEDFHLEQIQWRECGPCRQTLRVVRRFRQSTILQDYSLALDSPLLVMHTQVDWRESQVLVKAAFPWPGEAPQATYEIPFGAIERPTTAATPQAAARWEVPALRWADLSQAAGGLSLLTDCKHGFDSTPHQLRLTLLKSPLWPDPQADRGFQAFTYALYPHPGSWQQAATVQWARNLSMPLQGRFPQAIPTAGAPDRHSFLDLGDNSLVVAALKRSQDHPQRFILRLYESAGDRSTCHPRLPSGWGWAGPVDLLETPVELAAAVGPEVTIDPWQVLSLALEPLPPMGL